ncbi:hypothetical protein CROQUDRAFT_95538 [Cronartium quercuum f. sp. fusiforme G11]|uniref:aminodeoxychorismate synthase n=1 Tax=Cronartium quercuum f. sp. fusiforme G11 TaxID=708437 RepID=A0A9P6T9B9_9BASI|nr:hypothetical protein CROQUDRAFT_95538 [Cronartium quercuum f. sp. fusiforme G11]
MSNPVQLPRLLILDADDSYTNNILSLILSLYPSDSPQRASFENRVVVIRAGNHDWQTLTTDIVPHFAGLILGPGPGRPALPAGARDDGHGPHPTEGAKKVHPSTIFTRLFSAQPLPALDGRILPTLGICLGHQALGCAFGANIYPAPRVNHGQLCELELVPDMASSSILEGLHPGTRVVRYNSLVVDPAGISSELNVTAWARDGECRSVMGLSHRSLPFHGVQFHPESVCSTGGSQILRSFLTLVADSSRSAQPDVFTDLPPSILRLSSLPNRFNRPSNPHPQHHSLGSTQRPLFQLRTHQLGPACPSPQQLFQRLVLHVSPLGELWLDSADHPTARDERYSHLASPDLLLAYFATTRTLSTTNSALQKNRQIIDQPGLWQWLRTVQQGLEEVTELEPVSVRPPVGFVGYIGYELLSESLVGHRVGCRGLEEKEGVPDAELSFVNTAFTFDHQSRTWWAAALVRTDESQEFGCVSGFPIGLDTAEYTRWRASLDVEFLNWATSKESVTKQPSLVLRPRCVVSENDYLDAIDEAQQQILAGESYELCLTTKFITELPPRPTSGSLAGTEPKAEIRGHYGMYLSLREKNAAPYAAYVHFPTYDTTLLCSSPERFMRVSAKGWVDMKPIKGTARRVLDDPKADAMVAEALRTNAKERAENLMITDLIRHDLMAICEPSSVGVSKLIEIESVATVHSLVSTVVGRLRDDLNAVDALAGTFPPGSMTGAPKLSSVEILDRLEASRPRGVYSGILGFFALDGSAHFNVVIRTALIRNRRFEIGGGGAITALSNRDEEWAEVWTKVEAVMKSFSANG